MFFSKKTKLINIILSIKTQLEYESSTFYNIIILCGWGLITSIYAYECLQLQFTETTAHKEYLDKLCNDI